MADPEAGAEGERTRRVPPERRVRGRAMAPEMVRLSDIDLGDTTFQLRVSLATKELVLSLERDGLQEPVELVGLRAPYRVVDGFARIAAARSLGWVSIRAFVHRGMNDEDAMKIAFNRRVAKNDLSFPEKVHAIGLARRMGLRTEEIAELFGLTEKQVHRYLEHLSLPPEE